MTTEKVYTTSKDECQSRIDSFGTVCPGCGGVIVPIETVDNSNRPTYWAGCEECSLFTWGVPPLVFKIAEQMVKEGNYVHYSHMDNPYGKDENYRKYWETSQINGASIMIHAVLARYKTLIKSNPKLDYFQ